ncbi:DUF5305 domain-containing protein [Patescibacteria group bacterium]|nr:DUF5305 domain-containing protein [Patescibacteria group bacterium]
MLINILLLMVIFLSLIGVAVIIRRKFFSLTNINLEQVPEERAARIKKDLLEKKFIRQIGELKNKLKERKNNLKVYLKIGIDFFKKIKEKIQSNTKLNLIFLKNKLKFIKNKIMPR